MIITCPDCATRYDVDDSRFIPNGRSVRCTACTESWFVPAPEDLDMAPMEDLSQDSRIDEKGHDDNPKRGRSRLKVRMDDEPSDKRDTKKKKSKPSAKFQAEEDDDQRSFDTDYDAEFEDEDDDNLFGAVLSASKAKGKAKKAASKHDKRSSKAGRQQDEAVPDKGWRRGRQFIVEDDEKEDRRPFFSRASKKKNKQEAEDSRREAARDALRFRDSEEFDDMDEDVVDYRTDEMDDDHEFTDEASAHDEAKIVDADWEDVDEGQNHRGDEQYYEPGDQARGFGRRIRVERRRATAVARVEDVRRFDPAYFDEEFFASLRVTPRELDRAVTKARRRAESRAKNRMTPLRAFGWSAWVAAMAGTLYAVVAYRDDIVAFAPQTADAYAVIGIEANPNGLAIENVRHRLAMSTGGPMIEITGSLSNANGEAAAAPLLQAEALGPRGELLSRWTFTPEDEQIGASAAVEFMTRAPAPEGVVEVALSFAPTKTAISNLVSGGTE